MNPDSFSFHAFGSQLASLSSHRVKMRYSKRGPLWTRNANLLASPVKSSSRKQWKNRQLNKLSRMSSHKCAKGWSFAKNFHRNPFWITECNASRLYVARNNIPALKISSATCCFRNLGDLSIRSNQRRKALVAMAAFRSSTSTRWLWPFSFLIWVSKQRSTKMSKRRPFQALIVKQGKLSECNMPAVKYPWECLSGWKFSNDTIMITSTILPQNYSRKKNHKLPFAQLLQAVGTCKTPKTRREPLQLTFARHCTKKAFSGFDIHVY